MSKTLRKINLFADLDNKAPLFLVLILSLYPNEVLEGNSVFLRKQTKLKINNR